MLAFYLLFIGNTSCEDYILNKAGNKIDAHALGSDGTFEKVHLRHLEAVLINFLLLSIADLSGPSRVAEAARATLDLAITVWRTVAETMTETTTVGAVAADVAAATAEAVALAVAAETATGRARPAPEATAAATAAVVVALPTTGGRPGPRMHLSFNFASSIVINNNRPL